MAVKMLRPKKNGRPSVRPFGSGFGAAMLLNAVSIPELKSGRGSTTLIGALAMVPFCPAAVSVRANAGDGHRKPAAVGSLAGQSWLSIDDGSQKTFEPLSSEPFV